MISTFAKGIVSPFEGKSKESNVCRRRVTTRTLRSSTANVYAGESFATRDSSIFFLPFCRSNEQVGKRALSHNNLAQITKLISHAGSLKLEQTVERTSKANGGCVCNWEKL